MEVMLSLQLWMLKSKLLNINLFTLKKRFGNVFSIGEHGFNYCSYAEFVTLHTYITVIAYQLNYLIKPQIILSFRAIWSQIVFRYV